jgi:prepilin-type N-terminal cleavage/methylation domain-containing protein
MLSSTESVRAFTLIETILTIVIVSIIAGVSAKILLSGLDTYSFVVSRKDATQHARVAMDRMVTELTRLEDTDIRLMTDQNLSFIDNSDTLTSFKQVSANGQQALYREGDYLAGPLGFIDFDYLKNDGTSALQSQDVDSINVELSIDALGGHGSIILRTEIYPRTGMYDNFQ